MITNHAKCKVIMPTPYEGEIEMPNGAPSKSVLEQASYYNLPPLLFRQGSWAVCPNGTYCLTADKAILHKDLKNQYLIDKIRDDQFINRLDFMGAVSTALEMLDLGIIQENIDSAE